MSELEDIKNSLKAIHSDIKTLSEELEIVKSHQVWSAVVSDSANLDPLEKALSLVGQKRLVVKDLGDGTKFISTT